MKTNYKFILPLILISALLLLFAGCVTTPSDESPGVTGTGTIIGTIAAPCCTTSLDPVSETSSSPEYWCYYCLNTWNFQDGIEVVLTYGEDEIATVFTNEDGEYTFTNVDPGKNYVVTAYCPDFSDNRPLVKDVALELLEGSSFDTKITDLVSTSLGLVVDFLVYYPELSPEDISLDAVLADRPSFPNFPDFRTLVKKVRLVVENCELNLLTDDDVLYATCLAAEEISGLDIGCEAGFTPTPGPGPTPGPTPDECDGNLLPTITDVKQDNTSIYNETEINLVVGTPSEFCVTAADNDNKLSQDLIYYLTIDGLTYDGTGNCITITPEAGDVGTHDEVYLNVYDGCDPAIWGPVTIVVHDECYLNEAPVITDPSEGLSVLADEGEKFSYEVKANDDPTQTLTFTLDADSIVRGMTIDENTGIITWLSPICDCLNGQLARKNAPSICNYPVTVTVKDSCDFTDTVTFNVDVTCIIYYTVTYYGNTNTGGAVPVDANLYKKTHP